MCIRDRVEIYIDEIGWFPVEVVPGFYDMEKRQIEETEEDEKIEEQNKQNYQDEAPQDNQPEEKDEEDPVTINPLWLILLALLLLIGIFECAGRYRIRRLLDSFGKIRTDAQVYVMYRYVAKLMAFDGHKIPTNPYDRFEEISGAYDGATEISFGEFLRLVNRVRFGKVSLTTVSYTHLTESGLPENAVYAGYHGQRYHGIQCLQ